MRLPRIATEGIQALEINKLRTLSMMVGTIVGVAALVVIMAIGKGTEKKIMKRVQNFGPRAMMLIAGGGKDLPPPDMSVTTLTLEDAEAIRNQIKGLEVVSPMAWRFRLNVHHEANQYQTVVWGVEPTWHKAWDWFAAEGEGVTDEDVATMARVCVIGRTIHKELFGDCDPIGQRIYINKVALTVKGVLEERGASGMGGDFDNRVILPITTAMRRVMNVDYVGAIRIISQDPARMSQQAEAIRQLIYERHRINPSEEDDFRIITAEIIAQFARGTLGTLSILLIALAALSLIVGGVVLMNILLISVAERTQEIGLRRAVGATRRDIFVQFLTESLLEGRCGPPLDVVDSDESIAVKVELPGLKADDIELSVEGPLLTIAGEKKDSSEQKGDGYYHSERCYGRFHRVVKLSSDVDTDKVTTEFNHGVLTVTLPRVEGTRRRRIAVKAK